MRTLFAAPLTLLFAGLVVALPARSMGTAFTFQGSLEDGGGPASGTYDLQFRLMSPENQQFGDVLILPDVSVVGGVFTVQLDFGPDVLNGFPRVLQVGVRGGASTGTYTILTPNVPLHPAPYAQVALRADSSEVAGFAEVVGQSGVTTSSLVDGAVTANKIATDAVTASKLANNAVANTNVLNNSILPSRLAGELSSYTLTFGLGANACADADLAAGGDVVINDVPLLVLASGSSLPNNMSVTALRVRADNLVEVRVCNHGSTPASFNGLTFRLITFR